MDGYDNSYLFDEDYWIPNGEEQILKEEKIRWIEDHDGYDDQGLTITTSRDTIIMWSEVDIPRLQKNSCSTSLSSQIWLLVIPVIGVYKPATFSFRLGYQKVKTMEDMNNQLITIHILNGGN